MLTDEAKQKYLIVIYGKDGCDKCARLKKNVKAMLKDKALSADFAMDYQNLSYVEGMAAYAMAETINGQRLPCLQIMRYDVESRSYQKIPDPRPEFFNAETKRLFVPTYLQLQTEYGKSVKEISKADVFKLIEDARSAG